LAARAPYGLAIMRIIVDGMNVIGTRPDGWWKDRDAAMARLVDMLERFVAAGGDDVTVVFERAPRPQLRSPLIEIAHARKPGPDAADHEIVRRVREDSNPRSIRVVTSDHLLSDLVHGLGATVEPAAVFRERIDP
jgi:predicted RNA-binding protein with PIN domain